MILSAFIVFEFSSTLSILPETFAERTWERTYDGRSGYTNETGYFCHPNTGMDANNLNDAMEKCMNDQLCSMFYDPCGENSRFRQCNDTAYVAISECGLIPYSVLYRKVIAKDTICEDQIPETVICKPYPLTGQPLSCDDIPMGAEHFNVSISTICQKPISEFDCYGGGKVEDYCRKTCSNCRIDVLY